jgi:hypothetical protein
VTPHPLVTNPLIQRPGQRRVQEPARVVLPQALDLKFRQSRELSIRGTGREDQADRLGCQAARHERQHLRGGTVKALDRQRGG